MSPFCWQTTCRRRSDEITTTPYDIAVHLRTPEELEAYLEACI